MAWPAFFGDRANHLASPHEAATNLSKSVGCTALFTTNPGALPFEFTDFDVGTPAHSQNFYRVRQP